MKEMRQIWQTERKQAQKCRFRVKGLIKYPNILSVVLNALFSCVILFLTVLENLHSIARTSNNKWERS